MLVNCIDNFRLAGSGGWRSIPDIREEIEWCFRTEPRALEVSLKDLQDGEVFRLLYVIHHACIVWALLKSCLAHGVDHHIGRDLI